MKKLLLALAVAGAAVSAQADVSLSGHVNYVMGDTKDFTNVDGFDVLDNGASSSRFRIVGTKEHNGITYGTRQEWNVGGDTATNGGSVPTVRVNQFTIGGDFGQFSLGQGWESGDDITELDFSGTYIAGSGAGGYTQGGTQTDNVDGGRDQRLRYDSPKLGGIANIAIDFDENDDLGLAVLLGGDNWAAGAYTEQKDAPGTDEVGGSVALKVAGFTAALQFGNAENGVNNGDVDYNAVILGYNVGKVSVAIHSENREVTNNAGTKTTDNNAKGVSFLYRVTSGVELYAGYRTAESDLGALIYNNNTSDDGDAFVVGGRVQF